MSLFENAVIDSIKTEEFKNNLAHEIALLLIDQKFYEQDEDHYRTQIKKDIDRELQKIGEEQVSAAIKKCLESHHDVRRMVTDSLIPHVGKVIDEALCRREK